MGKNDQRRRGTLSTLGDVLPSEAKRKLRVVVNKESAKPSAVDYPLIPEIEKEVVEMASLLKYARSSRAKVETNYDLTPGRVKRMSKIDLDDLRVLIANVKQGEPKQTLPKTTVDVYLFLLLELLQGRFLENKAKLLPCLNKSFPKQTSDYLRKLYENGLHEDGQQAFSCALLQAYLLIVHSDKPRMTEKEPAIPVISKKIFNAFNTWGFLERYSPKGYGNIGYVYRVNEELAPLVADLHFSELRQLNEAIAQVLASQKLEQEVELNAEKSADSAREDALSLSSSAPADAVSEEAAAKTEETGNQPLISTGGIFFSDDAKKSIMIEVAEDVVIDIGGIRFSAKKVELLEITSIPRS